MTPQEKAVIECAKKWAAFVSPDIKALVGLLGVGSADLGLSPVARELVAAVDALEAAPAVDERLTSAQALAEKLREERARHAELVRAATLAREVLIYAEVDGAMNAIRALDAALGAK